MNESMQRKSKFYYDNGEIISPISNYIHEHNISHRHPLVVKYHK